MIRELETDGVPAPSDIELAAMDARPQFFKPFVAVRWGRLVTIVARTCFGLYRDTHGHLHQMRFLERDLDAYAERKAADARDQADTQQDALR